LVWGGKIVAHLEISHLVKRFGPITAVNDVSFEVERGEVLGFLGPNGAGKSTTMKMITGFLTPDGGNVVIGGDSISQRPLEAKRRLGYLPEGAPLYGDMTCGALLDFIAEVRGLRGAAKKSKVGQTIEQVNLGGVINQPIETLSKGFKRRVGLAQAILHDPEVLILDEPTDGLDPNQKHEVRSLIQSMATNKVIVLSTHILEEVEAVCSRAVIIAAGKVISDGTPAELEARAPNHNAVALSVRSDQSDEDICGALSALPGVESALIHADGADAPTHFEIRPQAGQSIVTEVSRLARDSGWEVEQLHVERGRLDEVFRTLTMSVARS
tara:strand:- start:558 stop:1535 length:978 start_codon:yes stop_codon:yes gene_type:complete